VLILHQTQAKSKTLILEHFRNWRRPAVKGGIFLRKMPLEYVASVRSNSENALGARLLLGCQLLSGDRAGLAIFVGILYLAPERAGLVRFAFVGIKAGKVKLRH